MDQQDVPCYYPIDAHTYVRNLLIDSDKEDDVRIHCAALRGNSKALKDILSQGGYNKWINFRVRPFMAPPLRLAVTGGRIECVRLLVEAGAEVDLEDVKGQTPLFVATSEKNLECLKYLLSKGASPEGSPLNSGRPLINAVRDGFVDGVEALLQYGANTEPFDSLKYCAPGWPLQISIVYTNFASFLALIKAGGLPNIGGELQRNTPVVERLSITHTILKYAKDRPEFVQLYHECGGDLHHTDGSSIAAMTSQEVTKSKAYEAIMEITASPMRLKCLCRLGIRKALGRSRLSVIHSLDLPLPLKSFLEFGEYR